MTEAVYNLQFISSQCRNTQETDRNQLAYKNATTYEHCLKNDTYTEYAISDFITNYQISNIVQDLYNTDASNWYVSASKGNFSSFTPLIRCTCFESKSDLSQFLIRRSAINVHKKSKVKLLTDTHDKQLRISVQN